MTSVDVYLLSETDKTNRNDFICRLLNKVYQRRMQCYVLADDVDTAHAIDEQLWTFKEDSFIPHQLVDDGPNAKAPIVLGTSEAPNHLRKQLLINLCDELPSWFTQYPRVVDVILNDEAALQQARTRYRQYQQAQCQIKTHDLRKEVSPTQ